MRSARCILLLVTLSLVAGGLPPVAAHHAFVVHIEAPSTCEPVELSGLPSYGRPLVRSRWDRASSVAPSVCLLPAGGATWECYYHEALPGDARRLCWWPVPVGLPPGAPARLDVAVDMGTLRELAGMAVGLPQVADLLGSGANDVEVRVDEHAALFHVEDRRVTDAFLLTPPAACTPFDAGQVVGAPTDARGACVSPFPPRPGSCRFVARPADADAFLCWWGRSSAASADFVLEMSADTLRGILNAEDASGAVKRALQAGYLTLWTSDLGKRAAVKAALEVLAGPLPDALPPVEAPSTQFTLQGRLFQVSYFPRDGVLTPCARDGQGTWFWLNEFGAPNGFVGSSTVRAMQLYLEEHGQLPSPDDVLKDLLINYRPEEDVDTPMGRGTVVYLFAPGSPFALIPLAQAPDGSMHRLRGDGSVARTLTAAEATQAAGRLAAAKTVTKDVDFNRQPGTLAQDLKFLRYAIERNPAAPQIQTLLRNISAGATFPVDDVAGMFPPEAPRIVQGLGGSTDVGAAVAAGDALLLGMASHTLIWQDLVAHGAIQPQGVDA